MSNYLALKNPDGTYSVRRLLGEQFPENALMQLPAQHATLEATQWLFSLNKDIHEFCSNTAPSGCEVHQWPALWSQSLAHEDANFVTVEHTTILNNMSWETMRKSLPEDHRSYSLFVYDTDEWKTVGFAKENATCSLKFSKIVTALYDIFADGELNFVLPGDVDELVQEVEIQLNDAHCIDVKLGFDDLVNAYEWFTLQPQETVSAFLSDWNVDDFMQWLDLCPEIQSSLTKNVLEKHVDPDNFGNPPSKKM